MKTTGGFDLGCERVSVSEPARPLLRPQRPMNALLPIFLVLVMLSWPGCGSDSSTSAAQQSEDVDRRNLANDQKDVRLQLVDDQVRAGDMLGYAIVNRSARPVTFGLALRFERREATSWIPANSRSGEVVPAVGFSVKAASASEVRQALVPQNFEEGLYRLVIPINRETSAGETAIHEAFRVE